MEETRFDTLMRRAVQQGTRRETLGALIGGALLLGGPAASEATRKGERRKHRKRRDGPETRIIKPVSAVIDNTAGLAPVTVRWGWNWRCCQDSRTVTVPAGERTTIDSPDHVVWLWIGGNYWFQLENRVFATPSLGIAISGTLLSSWVASCCDLRLGVTVEGSRGFKVNAARTYTIVTTRFIVRRNVDTRGFKSFTITLPPQLPAPGQ